MDRWVLGPKPPQKLGGGEGQDTWTLTTFKPHTYTQPIHPEGWVRETKVKVELEQQQRPKLNSYETQRGRITAQLDLVPIS